MSVVGIVPVASQGRASGTVRSQVKLEFVNGVSLVRKRVPGILLASSGAPSEAARRAEAWDALKDVNANEVIVAQDIARVHAGVVPETAFLLREVPAEFRFTPQDPAANEPDAPVPDQQACLLTSLPCPALLTNNCFHICWQG